MRIPTPPETPIFGSAARRKPLPPVRRFTDAHGEQWQVTERDAPEAPWARGPTFLHFETAGVVRRVWRYPGDWASLPDAMLEQLSRGR